MTDSPTGSGLSEEREVDLRRRTEFRGAFPARDVDDLWTEIDRLRADLAALREAGNALEEGARIIEVMLHERDFEAMTSAEDFATYLAGAWLGLAERMAAWRVVVGGSSRDRD